jgi:DNA gyrase subunit A
MAKERLIERFGLSDEQAVAILDMQLRRLAALEQRKLEDEYREVTARIEYLLGLLADPSLILALIREDLQELKDKYGDERRTEIMPHVAADLRMEDLVQDEDVLISISRRGYIKRTPVAAYRLQGRGGKGLIGAGTGQEDELDQLFAAGTLNTILYFTNRGKVYAEKAYQIPELDRTARGTSLMNILPLEPEERVTVALPVHSFDEAEYLTMITRHGRIKRTEVRAFRNVRSTGLIAVNLEEGDELGWVKMTPGGQDMILVSELGKAIRFCEEDVRPMGRTAQGVYAMRLAKDDILAGADVVVEDADLLVITENGHGKRTDLEEFRQQGRYGQGVTAINLTRRHGRVVGARVVEPEDEVTCITANGIIIRTLVDTISRQGRYSQGVRVMDLKDSDTIVSTALIREGHLSRVDDEE